jgi:fused signal recognition particle receptor
MLLRSKLASFSRSVAGSIGEKAKAFADGEFILDEKDIRKPLDELFFSLLESDVAYEVAEEIVKLVRNELVGKRRKWMEKKKDVAREALKRSILSILSSFDFDGFIERAEKPVNIVFVGVNGTGKTSVIAKFAHMLKRRGYSVVLASGDTYRAGATEQIDEHAKKLGVKLIKHGYGADPAAVVWDAVAYARARRKDFVLADTAGRTHTNINLMEQLRKICRVTSPELIIFVDDATAGNDAIERARRFDEALNISGSVLTKIDADPKGGTAISISFCTGKPILFLTHGQRYDDIMKFDPEWLVERIL